MKPDAWMKSGKYLPPILRDFHDQKDLFKSMHQIIDVDGHQYCKEVGWVAGQCYVIDIFLWFMARRGYTLQKSRQRLEFTDLHADLAKAKEVRDRAAAAALGLTPLPPQERRTGKVCGYHDGCPPDGPVCHLCEHLQPQEGR